MAEVSVFQPANENDLHTWFTGHNDQKSAIWIILFKKTSGHQTITLSTIIEEAICWGWIDSKTKTIDSERYAVYLSERQTQSHWTEANKATAERLIIAGRMRPSGLVHYKNTYT